MGVGWSSPVFLDSQLSTFLLKQHRDFIPDSWMFSLTIVVRFLQLAGWSPLPNQKSWPVINPTVRRLIDQWPVRHWPFSAGKLLSPTFILNMPMKILLYSWQNTLYNSYSHNRRCIYHLRKSYRNNTCSFEQDELKNRRIRATDQAHPRKRIT